MIRINYLFFTCLFLVWVSCKKKNIAAEAPVTQAPSPLQAEPVYDTVKPLSYFPVYPGSYWTYSDNYTYTTSPTYKLDSYCVTFNNSTGEYTVKSAYVPFYMGKPIWGYQVHDEQQFTQNPPIRFQWVISETIDAWQVSAVSHHLFFAEVIARDTTITISGVNYYPTIAVQYTHKYTYPSPGSPIFLGSRAYYTKDIGLVKTEKFNEDGTLSGENHIVSYFINK